MRPIVHTAKVLLVVLLMSCGWSVPAFAQLPVTDVGVVAAVGAAATSLKMIFDETRRSLAELANWPQVLQRLQLMAQLTADLEALWVEIDTIDEGWAQLSGSGQVLCTIDEALSWKGQALQWQHQALGIVRKANRVLGRGLVVLVDLQMVVADIAGPTGGAQSTSAILAVIASGVSQLHGLTASFQTVSIGKEQIESVIGIQLVCIQSHDYDHWGSYSR